MNASEWDMKTPGTGIPSPPTGILTLTRRPKRIGREFWRSLTHTISYESRFNIFFEKITMCSKRLPAIRPLIILTEKMPTGDLDNQSSLIIWVLIIFLNTTLHLLSQTLLNMDI